MFDCPSLDKLEESLADPQHPIGLRMRAAYYLRHWHDQSAEDTATKTRVVDLLGQGLERIDHGALMRHEFAYVLGQLRNPEACPTLERILAAGDDHVMVRHEAAEALGAIGEGRSKAALEHVRQETSKVIPELAETCQLALDVMDWRERGGDPDTMPAACACMLNPYSSVDPAPPHPAHADKSFDELGDILGSADLPLFERYRAMFSLRNRGGADAVAQLCRTLVHDASSALLRHEVAYVLGQMQHPSSVEALAESLRRRDEHEMVRHESAEALGAIDGRWDDVEPILKEFLEDSDDVVRESCQVALDAADYWGHQQQQQDGNDDDNSGPTVGVGFSAQKIQDSRPLLANHFNIATN